MSVKLWKPTDFTDAIVTELDRLVDVNCSGPHSLAGVFPEGLVIKVRSRRQPFDYFPSGALFIVSGRLRDSLESFSVHAEYFAVELIYRNSPYLERDYFFAHLLDFVDCFDFDRSEFEMDTTEGSTDYVGHVKQLVIDETKAAGHHLFKLARVWGSIICASDELAQAIESTGYTGIKFVPPSMLRRA